MLVYQRVDSIDLPRNSDLDLPSPWLADLPMAPFLNSRWTCSGEDAESPGQLDWRGRRTARSPQICDWWLQHTMNPYGWLIIAILRWSWYILIIFDTYIYTYYVYIYIYIDMFHWLSRPSRQRAWGSYINVLLLFDVQTFTFWIWLI